ncbi:MAG: hypothetical protein ACREXR_10740 [Gammaproteobacteria bacterium]
MIEMTLELAERIVEAAHVPIIKDGRVIGGVGIGGGNPGARL